MQQEQDSVYNRHNHFFTRMQFIYCHVDEYKLTLEVCWLEVTTSQFALESRPENSKRSNPKNLVPGNKIISRKQNYFTNNRWTRIQLAQPSKSLLNLHLLEIESTHIFIIITHKKSYNYNTYKFSIYYRIDLFSAFSPRFYIYW